MVRGPLLGPERRLGLDNNAVTRKKDATGADAMPDIGAVAGVAKLLADETRLRLLLALVGGEMNVTALCDRLGFDQPAVSHHLGLLRSARLVVARRESKKVFYRLATPATTSGSLCVAAGDGRITMRSARLEWRR